MEKPPISRYQRLSGINPLFFLALYLIFILVFGIVDWQIARDGNVQHYYAPYARMEPSSLIDKNKVETSLREAIIANLQSNESSSEAWNFDLTSLKVYGLDTPHDERITFTVYVYAVRLSRGAIAGAMGGPYSITMDRKRTVLFGTANPLVCHFVNPPAQSAKGFDFGSMFTMKRNDIHMPASVCWSVADDNRLCRLLAGWEGNPRGLSGFFVRMLYFSTITMTTVGFGDIIPLSGLARLIAGVEAVVGWLVAGLFLNAVAWHASQNNESKRKFAANEA